MKLSFAQLVKDWADAMIAAGNPDEDVIDLTGYEAYPDQQYNIVNSLGRDLAGRVATYYAKTVGYDPFASKDREPNDNR